MTAHRRHNHRAIVRAGLVAVMIVACRPADRDRSAGDAGASAEPSRPYVVDVVAREYAFDARDEIPSGWVTFRLVNKGKEPHFLLLNLLPEGQTVESYLAEIAPPFDSVWHRLEKGMNKAEAGALLGQLLPDWFGSVRQMGGVGLVAPGGVAETTVKLVPGHYAMECYVKTAEGVFHGKLGMVRALTVTEEDSGASPPEPDIEITLLNNGLAIEGDVTAGKHTVAVHYVEHPEFGLGNDVHLVRLTDDTDLDDVVGWMDWMDVPGLRTPAPAPFAGGAEEMPAGYTAYFTVNLTPGRWAWIAEASADRGMVSEFTIP